MDLAQRNGRFAFLKNLVVNIYEMTQCRLMVLSDTTEYYSRSMNQFYYF